MHTPQAGIFALGTSSQAYLEFVGLSADQKRLSRMLDSMAGLITGTRDALTRFTQPLTGSYYFVPSVESLRRLRGNHRLTRKATLAVADSGYSVRLDLVKCRF
jgi:deferrochelatase/peroxidase EfeB